MATRAKQARASNTVTFTGRVREWEKKWVSAGDGHITKSTDSGLKVLRWIPTGAKNTCKQHKRLPVGRHKTRAAHSCGVYAAVYTHSSIFRCAYHREI